VLKSEALWCPAGKGSKVWGVVKPLEVPSRVIYAPGGVELMVREMLPLLTSTESRALSRPSDTVMKREQAGGVGSGPGRAGLGDPKDPPVADQRIDSTLHGSLTSAVTSPLRPG
jgi:hypothetical protein